MENFPLELFVRITFPFLCLRYSISQANNLNEQRVYIYFTWAGVLLYFWATLFITSSSINVFPFPSGANALIFIVKRSCNKIWPRWCIQPPWKIMEVDTPPPLTVIYTKLLKIKINLLKRVIHCFFLSYPEFCKSIELFTKFTNET